MMLQDVEAQILWDTDPVYRANVERMFAADSARRELRQSLCSLGIELADLLPITPVEFTAIPNGGSNDFGSPVFGGERDHGQWANVYTAEAVKYESSLRLLVRWNDDRTTNANDAFACLIECWIVELNGLERDNRRHTSELEVYRQRGMENHPKAVKRRERLTFDLPEADAVKRRIAWARHQIKQ